MEANCELMQMFDSSGKVNLSVLTSAKTLSSKMNKKIAGLILETELKRVTEGEVDSPFALKYLKM